MVSEKVVVAVIAPEVEVRVIVKLVAVAVDEAEIAAVTWHGAVGVHGLLVNNTVTPEGRADSETVTGEATPVRVRSEEHTSELQSLAYLVCRRLLEKKNVKPIAVMVSE